MIRASRSLSTTPSRPRAPSLLTGGGAALYLLMVVLGVGFALAKQAALDFHERDFPYYAQFDVRAFDARYQPHYSLGPNGHDLFGFVGTEGVRSLHQGIHFEPMKYAMAAIHRLTGELWTVFAFIAALYFSPILYLATRLPRRDRLDVLFIALVMSAYALYPSGLEAVAFDLRPFSLLMPLFVMAALSVILERPGRETLFLFNALFLAREEALIFGLVVLLVALAVDQRRPERANRPPLGPMLGCYVTWTAVEIAYFAWCGYGNAQPLAVPLAIGGFALASAGAIVLSARRLRRGVDASPGLRRLAPLTSMLVLPPLVLQQLLDRDLVNHPELFLYAPMYALHAGCVLLAFLAAWTVLRVWRARRTFVTVAFAVVVVLLGALALPSRRGPMQQLAARRERSHDASLVFRVRDTTVPLRTSVLTDQATFQAFYDYEHVFVYERLPWHVIPGEGRRWPRNEATLRALMRDQIEWVVIARESEDEMRRIAAGAGHTRALHLVEANDRYQVYRVDRADQP